MDLVDALDAEGAAVAIVGAGGKKSTMYHLAASVSRAIVTATVRIPIFDPHVERVVVTDDPVATLDGTLPAVSPLGLVPEREGTDRYRGFDPATVDRLIATSSGVTILVKADGARMREFKAPGTNEPRIPSRSGVVVPVASAHAIGEPLNAEVVHRVDAVREVTGLDRGDPITPAAMATVIASPDGGYKGVPEGATLVPLINKVDDGGFEARARRVAEAILARCDAPRVVLTRLSARKPVVDVIARN